jgi:hypothetical protein
MSTSVFPADKYKFIKFERSHLKDKKYNVVLMHIATGRIKKIPFGQRGAAQYKDSTGLKLYSSKDHLDEERRKRYQQRHKGEGNITRKWSAGFASWHFLW